MYEGKGAIPYSLRMGGNLLMFSSWQNVTKIKNENFGYVQGFNCKKLGVRGEEGGKFARLLYLIIISKHKYRGLKCGSYLVS